MSAKIVIALTTVFIILIYVQVSMEANILGVFPSPSKSHQNVYIRLMQELHKRGHNLTVMTPNPSKDYERYKQIDVHDVSYDIYNEFIDKSSMNFPNNDSPVKAIQLACNIMLKVIDEQLGNSMMQNLIQNSNNQTFDLIFVEGIFPIAPAFKKRFKCPVILTSSIGLSPYMLDEFGNPLHPVLYPDMMAPYDPNETNVFQRFYLLIRHFGFKVFFYFKYAPLFEALTKKHFGNTLQADGSDDDKEYLADMVFINYHPIWHGVKPLVPAILPIWSTHISPAKPLPSRLQDLMDGARNGVIYLSFGTNVKSSQLSKPLVRLFKKTFEELPYTVIWKWEGEMPDRPKNVYTEKWLPQMAILNHSNTKLFITQGGEQSVQESIHCGVPMLVLPLMLDQEANGFRVEKHGIGKSMNAFTLTKESFKNTVLEIVSNHEYRSNITHLRDLLYDLPKSGLEAAVWWSEYIIRHKGGDHLRSPAANITLFRFLMVDLVMYTALVIAFIASVIGYVRRRIYSQTKWKNDFKTIVLYYILPIVLGNSVIYIIYYL